VVIKLTAGTSSNLLVIRLANDERWNPNINEKWTLYSVIILCFAADIILQVEETSRNYQHYYRYMGTLLDSTPDVPEDSESEMFPSLVIIIQMRWPNKSLVTSDSFPHTFIA
jgi:hypothetical protein